MSHRLPSAAAAAAVLLLAAGCVPRFSASDDEPSEPVAPAEVAAAALTVDATATAPAPAARRRPLPGVEVLLRDSLHLVRGRRAGLITSRTAVASDGRSAIDLLHAAPGVELVALFSPEHGIRGDVDGGVGIRDGRDPVTGLPVHSLYGRTQRPTAAMLRGLDVLLFDLQDVGARPYTYVWTMAMAMEAAARHGIRFVVLDRPNPVTARVEGPLMELEMRDRGQPITGYFPVPMRHGMTAGEIARYVNAEYGIGAALSVVPVEGWTGADWFDRTGLPWVNPSPNIRTLEAALTYSGLVMLEATNLSVGRGTDAPFSYVGAPYLDAPELLRRVHGYDLPGVEFELAEFTPRGTDWMQFRDRRCRGLRLRVTDRDAFQPVLTSLVFLVEIQRMHPRDLGMGSMLQMLGSRWAPAAVRRGDDPRAIYARWEAENVEWVRRTAVYRLYPAE
jgi:uncharacterized protein YbbC (DUF1343 family)